MVWKLLLKVRVERSGIYTRASGLKISAILFLLRQSYWHQSCQALIVQKSHKDSTETILSFSLFYFRFQVSTLGTQLGGPSEWQILYCIFGHPPLSPVNRYKGEATLSLPNEPDTSEWIPMKLPISLSKACLE